MAGGISFEANQRADRSWHIKSADLPGFHFVIGEHELLADFEPDLKAALEQFIPAYAAARSRHEESPRKGWKIRERRVFELEPA